MWGTAHNAVGMSKTKIDFSSRKNCLFGGFDEGALGEDGEEMKTATEWQTLESEDNFSKLNFSIRDEEPFPVA